MNSSSSNSMIRPLEMNVKEKNLGSYSKISATAYEGKVNT